MRILSLTTIYPSEERLAEGRSVAFLDQALAKLGIQGTTLVLKPWAPPWLGRLLERWRHLAVRRQGLEGENLLTVFSRYLHVPHRYHQSFNPYSMAHQAVRLIRDKGWAFDVVHGQSIYPSAPAARLVALHFKVPFVITLRDDLSHLSDWYEYRRGNDLFEPMFSSVSAVFVHGPSLLRDLPRFIPPGSHPGIFMAPNGVDVKGIQALLNSLHLPEKHPWGRIVSVGNLYRFKGIHENLQALKLLNERGLREWRYTVVGDGPYRKELEALSRKLGLESQVVFVGSVPHAEAIGYIRDADIFSLPSWGEPFGNVYGEAAVCGRPCIACKGFGGEITIRDGETGLLVSPKDVEVLADSLARLLAHPDLANEMGEMAREHIRQFTWEHTAQIYQQAINRVVAGGVGGRAGELNL